MGCADSCAKFVLVVINLIFLLASALLLAFGITAKASPADMTKVFSYIIPGDARNDLTNAGVSLTDIVVSNAAFMIVIGVIGIVIAGFGFFGACCMVKWLLVCYGIFMILLLLGEIALIIFAAAYTETFNSTVQKSMYNVLKSGYHDGIKVNSSMSVIMPGGAVELAWDNIQLKEKCCGANNWSDYSTFNWTNTGLVPPQVYTGSAAVPISCCLQYPNSTYPPTSSSFQDIGNCLSGNSIYISQQNCFAAVDADIQSFIRQYKGIAIGIAAGIAGIELILIIMAFLLCRRAEHEAKFA